MKIIKKPLIPLLIASAAVNVHTLYTWLWPSSTHQIQFTDTIPTLASATTPIVTQIIIIPTSRERMDTVLDSESLRLFRNFE